MALIRLNEKVFDTNPLPATLNDMLRIRSDYCFESLDMFVFNLKPMKPVIVCSYTVGGTFQIVK